VFRPTVAVLEFAGHGGRPCIDQRSGTLEEKYVHDVEVATALLRERGATVLWAGIPSGVGQLWARWWTSEIFATTAARWGEPAYYSDLSAQSVFDTATGTFTTHLPCLANETAFHGCVGGQIQVRVAAALLPRRRLPVPALRERAFRFGSTTGEIVLSLL